jgi:hypothetical protein
VCADSGPEIARLAQTGLRGHWNIVLKSKGVMR